MNLRDLLARANRLQNSTPFKVIASALVVLLAISLFVTYAIRTAAPPAPVSEVAAAAPDADSPALAAPATPTALDDGQRVLRQVMAARYDPTSVGIGMAVATGVVLVIIWLGLALTYLALQLISAAVAVPLLLLGMPNAARIVLGIVSLTAAFTALMQGLRIVLSPGTPVFAIARNVLSEAVRMNLSIVFIVLLVVGLATLPGLLTTPTLRYRVQAFLQYSTGGSFWLIALLVVVFGVATVAFEQRDKQIWQTMTKPVSSWEYILGKWLGLVGLSGVLLAVCCAGIFMFTEYLRQQPALGEDQKAASAIATGLDQSMSEDRFVLETQVLVARETVAPTLGRLTPSGAVEYFTKSDPNFQANASAFIQEQRRLDPNFATTDRMEQKVKDDLYKGVIQEFMTIEPMNQETYLFEGLHAAKTANMPLTLRYRVQSADNAPNLVYHLTFIFGGSVEPPQETGLDQARTLSLTPAVVDENGRVELVVVNGDLYRGTPNPYSISFPPQGLEISYVVGSYRMNFLRVALVLWVKLAFLAMLAVAAGTFLSFPVAVFVALCAFMAAEGAGHLAAALEYWDSGSPGDLKPVNLVIGLIGSAVAGMFKTYADLRPTQRLVDGQLVSWSDVAWGVTVLGAWTGILYAAAVGIFRRRELATYSGQ